MKKIIFTLLISLLLVSCALESKFSLPNHEVINQELIGTWFAEGNRKDSIIIQKNGTKKYNIIMKDEAILVSHSMSIKGFNIMNLEVKDKSGVINIFYGFEIKNDTLIFSEVTDKIRKEEFNSKAELLSFIIENIEREDFFVNPEIMIKK